jgi:hypothetical protein
LLRPKQQVAVALVAQFAAAAQSRARWSVK